MLTDGDDDNGGKSNKNFHLLSASMYPGTSLGASHVLTHRLAHSDPEWMLVLFMMPHFTVESRGSEKLGGLF